MKNVTCPKCGNYGSTGSMEDIMHNSMVDEMGSELGELIDLAFRPRGQIDGFPIWVCNKCESAAVWLKTGFFGKPKSIVGEGFNSLKNDWENNNDTKF